MSNRIAIPAPANSDYTFQVVTEGDGTETILPVGEYLFSKVVTDNDRFYDKMFGIEVINELKKIMGFTTMWSSSDFLLTGMHTSGGLVSGYLFHYDESKPTSAPDYDDLYEDLDELNKALQDKDKEVTELNDKLTTAENKYNTAQTQLDSCTTARGELETQLQTCVSEKESISDDLESTEEQLQSTVASLNTITSERDTALAKVTELEEALANVPEGISESVIQSYRDILTRREDAEADYVYTAVSNTRVPSGYDNKNVLVVGDGSEFTEGYFSFTTHHLYIRDVTVTGIAVFAQSFTGGDLSIRDSTFNGDADQYIGAINAKTLGHITIDNCLMNSFHWHRYHLADDPNAEYSVHGITITNCEFTPASCGLKISNLAENGKLLIRDCKLDSYKENPETFIEFYSTQKSKGIEIVFENIDYTVERGPDMTAGSLVQLVSDAIMPEEMLLDTQYNTEHLTIRLINCSVNGTKLTPDMTKEDLFGPQANITNLVSFGYNNHSDFPYTEYAQMYPNLVIE